jgi:hypothetical protein
MSDLVSPPVTMENWRFVERFTTRDPNAWFRIMPIGKFSRFGRRVEVTKQHIDNMARNFGIAPPTRLPVTVEHEDTVGKFGYILGVQSRADGLYASIDWTARGRRALEDEAFDYYSPEVFWGPKDYEGAMFTDILWALTMTNHPYFGEQTSLYTLDGDEFIEFEVQGGDSPSIAQALVEEFDMSEGNAVSDSVFEGISKFFAQFVPTSAPAVPSVTPTTSEPFVSLDAFNALKERADRLEQEKVEVEHAVAFSARVDKFKALLPDLPVLAEKFAAIADEALADDLAQEFKALKAQQSTAALFGELGTAGGDGPIDDAARFEALVEEKKKGGMSAADARRAVSSEHPDLYSAVRRASYSNGKGE